MKIAPQVQTLTNQTLPTLDRSRFMCLSQLYCRNRYDVMVAYAVIQYSTWAVINTFSEETKPKQERVCEQNKCVDCRTNYYKRRNH